MAESLMGAGSQLSCIYFYIPMQLLSGSQIAGFALIPSVNLSSTSKTLTYGLNISKGSSSLQCEQLF